MTADQPITYTTRNRMIPILVTVGLLPLFVIGLLRHSPFLTTVTLFVAVANLLAYWLRQGQSLEVGPAGVVIRDRKLTTRLAWTDIATVARVPGPLRSSFIEIRTAAGATHELSQELARPEILAHLQRYKPG